MNAEITIQMAAQAKQNIAQTIKEYGRRLFGFIRSKVKSNEDAEDILQDVWYQLSNLVNTAEIEQMSGWLFRVARNKITDKYRKKKEAPLDGLLQEDEDENGFGYKEILFADNSSPETRQLHELFWQELFAALDELPQNQREVFILNELEELTLQQIADKTGENLKTIISRKGYAVKHLRKRLESLYNHFTNY